MGRDERKKDEPRMRVMYFSNPSNQQDCPSVKLGAL
jgi:hypothetical protein